MAPTINETTRSRAIGSSLEQQFTKFKPTKFDPVVTDPMRYNPGADYQPKNRNLGKSTYVAPTANTQQYVNVKQSPSKYTPTPTWQNSPKAENMRGTIDYSLKNRELAKNLASTPLGNPRTINPSTQGEAVKSVARSSRGASVSGGGFSGAIAALGNVAFQQYVITKADEAKPAREALKAQWIAAGLDPKDLKFNSIYNPSFDSQQAATLEQARLQQYIDRELAKPEVRRKLYDAIMANQASGGFQGRMNSASPTAGTRPSLPAYTPRIPDPNFPGGFVPASAEERAKLLQSDPGFNPLAGEIPSFAPSDFLIPKDPNYVAPKSPVGIYNGNIPDTFAPSPQPPNAVAPGSQENVVYHLVISYSYTDPDGVTGPTDTRPYDVWGRVSGIVNDQGSVGFYHRGSSTSPGAFERILHQKYYHYGGSFSTANVSMSGLAPLPGYPPDPYVSAPQPAPQIPTDPDTGRPNLPDIGDLKPSIDAPTSPTRTPTPSPRNSPTGKPSLQTPPESTPRLNPTSSPNLQPLLDLLPAIAPASPSNPLANPSLPLNNPATSANTSNPTQPASGSGTGVTINGEPVQNGDTPIRQISAQPSRQITPSSNVSTKPNTGTYTTINGEPVNVPKDVTTPKGTIDPQKVEQQQQQKQPQPQPEAPRNTCDDPCIQGLSDKLDQQSLTAIEVNVFDKCDVDKDEPVFKKQSFKVPASLSITLKAMLNNLAQLQGNECKGGREAIASVPEWWQARRGSNIPQLAILFAEQFSSGKLGGSRWTLCIPHYNRPKGSKPAIPTYDKGNWFGTLKLTDGSKLGVNAASSSECKRVLNRLKIHIPVEFRTSKGKAIKPRIVEDPTADFKQCKVTPVRADYYSKGQTNMTPDWSINLRKK